MEKEGGTSGELKVKLPVEVGKVSEDIYIKVPFSDHDEYIYITSEGRIWGQVCEKKIKNPHIDCNSGVDLTVKDIYEIFIVALEDASER